MNTKNIRIKKQAVALMLLVAIAGISNIALAAQEKQPQIASSAAETYVMATQATAMEALADIDPQVIVHDTFLLAKQVPVSKATPTVAAREIRVTSTGYNSEESQTDSTPFITADGTYVFDGLVAANFLPMGTKIMFPDHFPGKVFTVHDRMNKRFSNRVDIWFPEHEQAVQWGKRDVRIQILES